MAALDVTGGAGGCGKSNQLPADEGSAGTPGLVDAGSAGEGSGGGSGGTGGSGAIGGTGGSGAIGGTGGSGAIGGFGGGPAAGASGASTTECSSEGWCCGANGLCCNPDLGVCRDINGMNVAGGAAPSGSMAGAPQPLGMPVGVTVTGSGGELIDCHGGTDSQGAGHCTVERYCNEGFATVSCDAMGDEWHCGCEREFGFTEYQLTGGAGSEACDQVVELCSAAPPEVSDTEETCLPSFGDTEPGYCLAESECRRSFQPAEGVSAETVENLYAHCNREGDVWFCDCSKTGLDARFELRGDRVEVELCSEVTDICRAGPIETTGEPECSPKLQGVERAACSVQLECGQDAMLGAQAVRVFQYRSVQCAVQSGEQWGCTCSGVGVDTSFELEGTDAWAVCGEAGAQCAALSE